MSEAPSDTEVHNPCPGLTYVTPGYIHLPPLRLVLHCDRIMDETGNAQPHVDGHNQGDQEEWYIA